MMEDSTSSNYVEREVCLQAWSLYSDGQFDKAWHLLIDAVATRRALALRSEPYPMATVPHLPNWPKLSQDNTIVFEESSAAKENEVKSSLPAHIRSITEFVGHRDEERVLMTVQSHGFPLYSLSEIHDCRLSYDSCESSERDLAFVFPDRSLTHWKLQPAGAKESKLQFGVALALNAVRRAGDRYMYLAPHARAHDSELAGHQDPDEARRGARDAFLDAGYASEIEAFCRARMEREGNQPLYDELQGWVQRQEGAAKSPDYPTEFKIDIESVKAYLDTIRPF